jgi:alcohol dehydrogenase (NADP+)
MAAAVPTLTLPSGSIPRIGYGTGTFWGHYRTGISEEEVNPGLVDALRHALRAGVRHIDCAEMYGTELSVGEGLRQAFAAGDVSREEVWVTSKILNESKMTPAGLRAACARSLERLGLGYLDLYLLHSPFGPDDAELSAPEQQAIWLGMEGLHNDGLVRNIGCSNHRVADLSAILATPATVRPAVNQIEFNPLLLSVTEPTLRFCAEQSIVVEAYSALSSLVYEGARDEGGPLDTVVETVASAHGVGAGAVLLRWNLHKGTVVISTSTKPHRVEETLRVFEFELSAEEIDAIDSAASGLKPHKQFWQNSVAAAAAAEPGAEPGAGGTPSL